MLIASFLKDPQLGRAVWRLQTFFFAKQKTPVPNVLILLLRFFQLSSRRYPDYMVQIESFETVFVNLKRKAHEKVKNDVSDISANCQDKHHLNFAPIHIYAPQNCLWSACGDHWPGYCALVAAFGAPLFMWSMGSRSSKPLTPHVGP